MIKPTTSARANSFVLTKLPWIVAGVALILYLVTLNTWVSFSNLSLVAQSSGWQWGPELYGPLFYLVTFPFRWLPAGAVPVAFNLFSALCGVLSLALLARSVALLPQDRTRDQRLREKSKSALLSIPTAWLPPVLATAMCGLGLTFWESATAGANSMFELLLFAYVIRNILEYRHSRQDSWIFRASLVCGAGMANGWLMFIFFPAIMISLIWIKGLEFFNARFLLRAFLCGVAGMLLYLLMPAIHALSADHTFTFWQALKINLGSDKQAFLHFILRAPLSKRLLLGIISVFPLLLIGIRWPSNFGDTSKTGSSLATLCFHLVHAALLVFGVWIAFDPPASPRHLNYAIPAFYYLSALSVGYLSGYFLLVFRPLPDRMGRTSSAQLALYRIASAAILILLVVVPIGLIARNLSQIRMTNGPAVKDYASQLIEHLPNRAVLISDDARRLYLAEAALARKGTRSNYVFLESHLLNIPDYHLYQLKLHPDIWPAITLNEAQRTNQVGPRQLLNLIAGFTTTNAVCYLHPSFGYFFEVFNERQQGLSVNLSFYPSNSISGPPLTSQEIADNQKFWNDNRTALERLKPFISPPPSSTNASFSRTLLAKLHLPFEPNDTAVALGALYSQPLNFWGVQMQRADQLDEANKHFQLAADLFPDNIAAENNLAFNADLRAGRRPEVRSPRSVEDELGKYRNWEQLLGDTGPFDDPTHCFILGLTFAQGNNFRQAAQQLERVHALVPENVQATYWLARLYIMNQKTGEAQTLLTGLRDKLDDLAATGIRRADFLQTQATAYFADNQPDRANQLLQSMMEQNAKDPSVLKAVAQVASVFHSYTNALRAVDLLLKLNPDDVSALLTQGVFNIQAGNFSNAIPPLTRALSLQTTNNYNIQLYRAIAYLNNQQLDEAQQDYETLAKAFPNSNDVNSGLGEIALRRKDTNTAVRYFELCLTNFPAGSEQAKAISARINSLKSTSTN